MKHFEFNWKTAQGISIYAQGWQPEGDIKATILIIHGLGEHGGRYADAAAHFVKYGYASLAMDHHGHGKTSGKKGHVANYEYFWDEADALLAEAKKRYPGKPVFVWGHSMGGNIALSYMLGRKPAIKGLIGTGSFIKLAFEPPALLLAIGRITRKLMPGFIQHNQVKPEDLSHDPAVVEAYKKDPLVGHSISSELGLSLLERGHELFDFKGEVPCPVLLMHGKEDHLTSPLGTETFGRQAKGDVTVKMWDGMYHEIHNEVGKEEVLEYMRAWMERV